MTDKPPDVTKEPPEPVAGEAPKKRRGRPPGSTTRKPRLNVEQLKRGIEQALVLANTLFIQITFPQDVLDNDEIILLSDGVAAEIEANPKLARWATKAGGIGAHGKLIYACVIIAYPRLVRHGIIPTPASVSVASRGTPSSDRGYRDGEVDFDKSSDFDAGLHADSQDESGPGKVSRKADTNIAGVR